MKTKRGIDWSGMLMVLLTPACWVQVKPYSEEWDRQLNQLMQLTMFQLVDRYTAKIGDQEVWIGNHPYGSFMPWPHMLVRPSRATILRARKKLEADIFAVLVIDDRKEVAS